MQQGPWQGSLKNGCLEEWHKIILKFPVVKAACQGTETLTF